MLRGRGGPEQVVAEGLGPRGQSRQLFQRHMWRRTEGQRGDSLVIPFRSAGHFWLYLFEVLLQQIFRRTCDRYRVGSELKVQIRVKVSTDTKGKGRRGERVAGCWPGNTATAEARGGGDFQDDRQTQKKLKPS